MATRAGVPSVTKGPLITAQVEEVFAHLKDPLHVMLRPQYHWTVASGPEGRAITSSHIHIGVSHQNLQEKLFVPGCAHTPELDTEFGVLERLEEVEGQMAHDREVLRGVSGTHAAIVLTEDDIEDRCSPFSMPQCVRAASSAALAERPLRELMKWLGGGLSRNSTLGFDHHQAAQAMPVA
jgi:hypothetical protein